MEAVKSHTVLVCFLCIMKFLEKELTQIKQKTPRTLSLASQSEILLFLEGFQKLPNFSLHADCYTPSCFLLRPFSCQTVNHNNTISS